MRHFRRLFDLFLFSNIFISLCAGSMVVETYLISSAEINWLYTGFVFISSLVLYNYPGLFLSSGGQHSERQRWIVANKKSIRVIFVIALAASGSVIIFLPLKLIVWFVPVTLLSFAYFLPATNLRSIPVVKTIVVAFVWTCITCFFPLHQISNSFPSGEGAGLSFRFFFLLSIAIAFNIRDIEVDRQSGVKTFPVIFGIQRTKIVCVLFLLVLSALVFSTSYETGIKAALLISAAAAGVLIVCASQNRSEYYYSLWMDGMILLQALLIIAYRLYY